MNRQFKRLLFDSCDFFFFLYGCCIFDAEKDSRALERKRERERGGEISIYFHHCAIKCTRITANVGRNLTCILSRVFDFNQFQHIALSN